HREREKTLRRPPTRHGYRAVMALPPLARPRRHPRSGWSHRPWMDAGMKVSTADHRRGLSVAVEFSRLELRALPPETRAQLQSTDARDVLWGCLEALDRLPSVTADVLVERVA